MIKTARQLKDLVRNKTMGDSLKSQVILRNYIMERFLERLSNSEFRNHFVLKGGMLISAIVGIDNRSTMDIDATIKNLPLNIDSAKDIVEKIISVPLEDNVSFSIKSMHEIMEESEYGGIRMNLESKFDTMLIPIKIDISTGDVITPREIEYHFRLMFENRDISILAYNMETVLAEKLESILSKSITNTRMRDFYDIYILTTYHSHLYDEQALSDAFGATCKKRNSTSAMEQRNDTVATIKNSKIMIDLWNKYQKKYSYAEDITWDMAIHTIENTVALLKR
ncbi:MAG: nucleotidyl transferase AbiEii/AbiGii toxin family protein [Eubacteriales bacterium]